MIALMLAKSGYYAGNVENIYNSKVDNVFETYHYEMFIRDYERAFAELNKPKEK